MRSLPTVLWNSSFNIKLCKVHILCVCVCVCVYGVYVMYEILLCTHHEAKNVSTLWNSMSRNKMKLFVLQLLLLIVLRPECAWALSVAIRTSYPSKNIQERFSLNCGEGTFLCHGLLSFI